MNQITSPSSGKETFCEKHLGYALISQLIGCILLFGAPFFFIAHFGHHIPLISGVIGAIICTVNYALDGGM